MPRKSKRGRPAPFSVTTDTVEVRVRCIAGPREPGVWRWRAEYHQERITVWSGWGTRTDAQRETFTAISGGIVRPPSKDDTAVITTVADLMGAWLAQLRIERPERKVGTVKAHKLSARHVRELVGAVLVRDVDNDTISELRAGLLAAFAPRTARTDLGRFMWACRMGMARGWMERRELVALPIRVAGAEPVTPTISQAREVIRHARIPWRRLALRLQFATGARVGEVARLTRDRFDEQRGEVNLRDKQDVDRWVPIPAELVEALAAHAATHEREELLGVGRHAVRNGLNRELRRACEAAGVRYFSSHGFRRLVVDTLYEQQDPKTSGAVLGHSDQVALEHYRRVRARVTRRALLQTGLGRIDEAKIVRLPGSERGGARSLLAALEARIERADADEALELRRLLQDLLGDFGTGESSGEGSAGA